MEHLSRRTTRDVDRLVLVSDPSQRGLAAARQMAHLAAQLDIRIGKVYLVMNRVRLPLAQTLADAVAQTGLELLGQVPEDPTLAEFEMTGRPLIQLPTDSPVYQAVRQMAPQLMER